MAIVTISREVGAGGSSVGALVAARLGCEVLDRAIVAEVSRRLSLSPSKVEAADEHPLTLADRLMDAARYLAPMALWVPPEGDIPPDPLRGVPDLTQQFILEVARRGEAVIVGRGAAYVLAGWPGTLHVFLRAPEDVRTRMIMERLRVDEPEARRRLRSMEMDRAAYVRQVYHRDWLDPSAYDLVINTGRVGIGGAADLILGALRAGRRDRPGNRRRKGTRRARAGGDPRERTLTLG